MMTGSRGRRLATIGVACVAALGAIGTTAAPAQAIGGVAVPGVTRAASYNNCIDMQRTYNSAWTKIVRSCYYTGYEGGRHWHSFEYRTIY